METIRCKNNYGKYSDIPKEKFFFRPSVYGLILKNDKIVLLTSKSNGKFWFPGGGIEVGEKIEDALKREILEETGLKIEIIKPILFKENFFYYEPNDEAFHAFLFFFLCRSTNETELIKGELVDDFEATKPRWIELNSLKQEDFSDCEADSIKMIRLLNTGH